MGADLARLGPRFAAFLLDALPVVLVAFVAAAVTDSRDDASYAVIGAAVLTSLLYSPPFLCRSGAHNGQTPGKQALGIRVVRADAAPMTASPALLREFVGKGVLGLIPFFSLVDLLFPLGDPRRQALHDKLATTFVVRADAVPDLPPEAGAPAFGRPSPER